MRQRPQTAKGHVFLSLEDESGVAIILQPAVFEAQWAIYCGGSPSRAIAVPRAKAIGWAP